MKNTMDSMKLCMSRVVLPMYGLLASDVTEKKKGNKKMHKLIAPMAVFAMLVCANTAGATSVGLSLARSNLYNTQMRAYNAKINYYQGASLHYLNKMPALTAAKYGYKYNAYATNYKKSFSTKLVVPTTASTKKAINATSVSQLMAALKGWGRY